MPKIAFWDNCLCERGTTVALYDYAYYNRALLGNESIILYNTTRKENVDKVIEKFSNEFQVFGVSDFSKVDAILLEQKCDIFYIIKGGGNEGQVSKVCKTVVHCVFNYSQPHGDVYAGVSNWIHGGNGLNGNRSFPVVPHMVHLPDNNRNLRERLGIPEDATVYGRHGGYEQFDIPFVHRAVYETALQNKNIYFIFVNTATFCPRLPNIIHLSKIIDLNEKAEFINTCDAMLWARQQGESFGLSIAEFSIKNKPVLVTKTNTPGDVAHIHLLKDKGIWYNQDNLKYILTHFNRAQSLHMDWNAYKEYTPEKVMEIFKKVFID